MNSMRVSSHSTTCCCVITGLLLRQSEQGNFIIWNQKDEGDEQNLKLDDCHVILESFLRHTILAMEGSIGVADTGNMSPTLPASVPSAPTPFTAITST